MTVSTTDDTSKLMAELADDVDADLRGDSLHRRLYAQDASIYEEQPMGAVFPRSTDEVRQIVEMAERLEIPLIPRAGGTSLAGQCVGEGLVVDMGRHMNEILEVDAEEGWARVQPGVILDELNRHVAPMGWVFGPDTSTSSRCQIGGMIGNNSCGAHSVYFGTTRDHVRQMEVVFSDGTVERVGDWDEDAWARHRGRDDRLGDALRALEEEVEAHADLVRERYPHPEMIRRNTGYPFDALLERKPFEADGPPFSLAPFLCGTEGTLGLVTEAKVNLEPRPTHNILVCAHFETLDEALRATVEAVSHEPGAVELMDKRIMDLTKGHPEHHKNRFFVEGDPGAVLVIEYYGDSEEDVEAQAEEGIAALEEAGLGYAFPKVRAPHDERVWKLRKAGLGLLMGIKGDTKPVTLVEDTAVPLWRLPEYARDFGQIMDNHDTRCVYYAHASVGELHLRPELNLKEEGDAQKFEAIAGEVTDLVRDYQGALSGEHGDGRLRSPMLERFYGEELMAMHRRIKAAFDPKGLMNPGKIVDPAPLEEDWRVTPGEDIPELETVFDWSEDQGLLRSVEKCNGAGVCRRRSEEGATMCPSYMATLEEKDTTRGRANVFRQLLRSEKPQAAFDSEDLHEAMDLCLSCKGCKTECPANVDMARMKAEFLQHYHDRNGTPRSATFFGQFADSARLASWVPWLVNFFASFFLTRWIINRWYGIAPQRELPRFAGRTARSRFERHDPAESAGRRGTVWLYIDPFTEYTEPEIAMAAVEVLEAGGWAVELLPITDDGRTHISKGLVREARELSNVNMEAIAELLEAHPQRPVVGLEPSALLTFRDETPDLVDDRWESVADDLADRAVLFEEFVAGAIGRGAFGAEWAEVDGQAGRVALHGHCHQKALVGTEPTEKALRRAGYEVETIPSGCCGMAGSFGYEAAHYEVSMEIGELVLFPAVREAKDEQLLCAPGTSCRDQIGHGTGEEAVHPAVLLRDALDR